MCVNLTQTATQYTEITARFIRRLYRSADNTFCIGRYEDVNARKGDCITLVGANLPELSFPVTYCGNWENSQYGRQFKVEWLVSQLPDKTADIEEFICSMKIGIGKKRVRAMIQLVGKDAFWPTLNDNPETFLKVSGINEGILEKLQSNIHAMSYQKELLEYFHGDLQITGQRYKRLSGLFKNRMDEMLPEIRKNPFLLQEIGVPFSELDYFCARNSGFAVNDNRRLTAATIQVLLNAQNQGHVGVPEEQMATQLQALLSHYGGLPRNDCQMFLDAFLDSRFVTHANGLFYLTRAYDEEQAVVNCILKKLKAPIHELDRKAFEEEVAAYGKARKDEKGNPAPIVLAPGQLEAVYTALTNRFCVVTGGPGTGKSTILDVILHCWKKFRKEDDWTLMAPTGKAAVRMTQATGQPAGTIHSPQGLGGSELPLDPDAPSMHPEKLEKGLVVVDEASMLDLSVATALLQAADKPDQHLVLVGDPDQLPSVGYGNVLADLISSGVVPVAKLTTIYRQAAGNPIIINSAKIRDGDTELDWSHSFFKGYNQGTDAANMEKACQYFMRCVNKLGIKNVAMLSPYHRKGAISTQALNARLQEAFNPNKGQGEVKSMGETLRVGDRVMQLKNTQTVINGDVGTISMVNADAEVGEPCVVVDFDYNGMVKEYTKDELNQLELAYAFSVHKSQGSQYPCVVMMLPNEHSPFLRRNLVYTGMTRASKYMAFFGPMNTLKFAIQNNKQDKRFTALAPLLQKNTN